MATVKREWYPDGITCLQVYQEFHDSFFGAINGSDIMETQSRDEETTTQLLEEYYESILDSPKEAIKNIMEENKDKISIGTVVDKSNTNELFHITNPEGIIQITGTGFKDEVFIPPHIENRGKIVYVIDRSGDFSYIDDLKKILGVEKDSGTEIICVQSPEHIPFEARLKPDFPYEEVHKISMLPKIEDLSLIKPKCKGHERPYRYHK